MSPKSLTPVPSPRKQKVIARAFHTQPPPTLPLEAPSPGHPPPTDCHPLLTILVRDGSRKITNVEEVVGWAHEAGFAVRLVAPTHGMRLEELWALLQEADVMLGVHGAALTHWIFLRPMTVFIQVGGGVWGMGGEGGEEGGLCGTCALFLPGKTEASRLTSSCYKTVHFWDDDALTHKRGVALVQDLCARSQVALSVSMLFVVSDGVVGWSVGR